MAVITICVVVFLIKSTLSHRDCQQEIKEELSQLNNDVNDVSLAVNQMKQRISTLQASCTRQCEVLLDISTAKVHLPFDTISSDDEFKDGTFPTKTWFGKIATEPGIKGNALHLDGTTVFTIGNIRDSCFWNPQLCSNGFTLALWLRNENKPQSTFKHLYLISNGGQTSGSFGFFLLAETRPDGRGLLIGMTAYSERAWVTDESWKNYEKDDKWIHIGLRVNSYGAYLYENGILLKSEPKERRPGGYRDTTQYDYYVFGSPNNYNTTQWRGKASIDDLLFWDTDKGADFMPTLFSSYFDHSCGK